MESFILWDSKYSCCLWLAHSGAKVWHLITRIITILYSDTSRLMPTRFGSACAFQPSEIRLIHFDGEGHVNMSRKETLFNMRKPLLLLIPLPAERALYSFISGRASWYIYSGSDSWPRAKLGHCCVLGKEPRTDVDLLLSRKHTICATSRLSPEISSTFSNLGRKKSAQGCCTCLLSWWKVAW